MYDLQPPFFEKSPFPRIENPLIAFVILRIIIGKRINRSSDVFYLNIKIKDRCIDDVLS